MAHLGLMKALLPVMFLFACSSNSDGGASKQPKKEGVAKENTAAKAQNQAAELAKRVAGYGDFLFIPKDSITIRNFVDVDGDGTDDRHQLYPGGKSYPIGHFYK
jgi:hypothetical protein